MEAGRAKKENSKMLERPTRESKERATEMDGSAVSNLLLFLLLLLLFFIDFCLPPI